VRHYTRFKTTLNGVPVISLINNAGKRVEAFDLFVAQLIEQDAAHQTLTRYSDVVANFVDYLTEADVFGTAATLADINTAVERYIPIRVKTDNYRARYEAGEDDEYVQYAGPIIKALNITALSPASLSNTIAAINDFLRLAERTHRLKLEAADFHGHKLENADAPNEMFEALQGAVEMTPTQKHSMLQHSMLAGVVRLNPEGIKRPRGLAYKPKGKGNKKKDPDKDFPMEFLSTLFDAATSWRDRAIWILMASAGLRTSEAAQVLWSDIDIALRKVWINDPEGLRFSGQLDKTERLRFKGRDVTATYLMQPLRDLFFEALENYMRFEYTPGVNHDFVFQDIRKGQNGRPYYEMSDQSQVRAFNRACDKIGVSRRRDGKRYGKHSLRHFYGVFMLNYLPVPGGYGLQLDEVRQLMGHTHIETTSQYAKKDKTILQSKLLFADRAVVSAGDDLVSLPALIAERLEFEAKKIRGKL